MTNNQQSKPAPAKISRIALLVTDTPMPSIVKAHGDYEAIFTRLFEVSKPQDVPRFRLDAFDVRNKMEYPPESILDEYMGIVITGSAANAYEDIPWINKLVTFVKRLAITTHRIKIIGVCFGHQIVARALGGEVRPNDGKWEVGITPIQLTDLGKRIFHTQENSLNIQQMHRDHVPEVPPSFHLLASTEVSKNQGMVRFAFKAPAPGLNEPLPPIHILTVQGHPEFTKEIVHELVEARLASGIINSNVASQARKRADWRNDGPTIIGRAIWEVLRT
ncbi:class I glutamine amidotransferase-like protein [Vararia minispora EC-137]|uniref:Class I glutamine amidotransferase-like protein n=1 Tax=Vararia minispora EC-137 TaxID=1314806 RepID=A0ACB8QES3_9AGAM|nr:class I glutamine amidotransferase-like protein [Vararia minispora EC-137]